VHGAGGVLMSQGILIPELLIAVGEELAETVKFAGKKKNRQGRICCLKRCSQTLI
jgi:hypothetical protein